jgi:hypothetical protein
MSADGQKTYDWITDFVSGRRVPNIGAEEHRQAVEEFLVKDRGYPLESIGVDVDLSMDIRGERYSSQLDLVVTVRDRPFMVIKCAAGSLGSREKEVIAAARVVDLSPAPYAVVSDGKTAIVYDALSRGKIGEGLSRIPSYAEAKRLAASVPPEEIPETVRERDKIIFRSYDAMNLNVQRRLQ